MITDFIPQYTQDVPLQGFTRQEFLVLAIEAATRLNWLVNHISDAGLIAHTNNGANAWNAVISIHILEDKVTLTSKSTGTERVDLGRNQENIYRFQAAFRDVSGYFTPEDLRLRYEELQPALMPPDQDRLQQEPFIIPNSQPSGLRSFFMPVDGYFMTPILIAINLVLFIIMCLTGVDIMEPDSASLLKWGANFRPLTLDGQWWRLLTCCFLHIGVVHLLMNMYALFFIGVLLEPFLGKARFLAAYLLTGIVASVTSLWWHDVTISAGASGAVFGMYGVFLAMLTTNFIDKRARKPMLVSIGIFVAYNLIYGMKSGIDNAAHTGGLLSGLAIGYAYIPGLKKPNVRRIAGMIALLSVVVLTGAGVVYKSLPNDFKKYERQMAIFSKNERSSEALSQMQDTTNRSAALSRIDSGIHYWEDNIGITNAIAQLKLPAAYKQHNGIVMKYTQLRLDRARLFRKAFAENTNTYDSLFANYNLQIEATLQQLNQKTAD